MPTPTPPTSDRIMDVFYFIGYTSSAVARLQSEVSKLSLDPSRWSKTDREFLGSLALQAAHSMGEMAELCLSREIDPGMTEEDIKARLMIDRAGWEGA